MTEKEREIALYCLKANSDYHSEVCEECINYPNCDHTIQDDVTETIIKALEQQEPCDDTISRQAALDINANHHGQMPNHVNHEIWKEIKALPPVTPQPEKIRVTNIHFDEEKLKEIWENSTLTILDDSNTPTIQPETGRWITQMIFQTKLHDEPLREYECSECGRRIRCTKSQLVNYPYCHCGAKMAESEG